MPDPFGSQPRAERRDTRSRDELIRRIRTEFDGLAGLTLTLDQAARLFHLDKPRCARLLDELVRQGELTRVSEEQVARPDRHESST
jgi:hypothetical protein